MTSSRNGILYNDIISLRKMPETPLDLIVQSLRNELPKELIEYLPTKWEKVGNVLIVKLHPNLASYQELIGKTYAEILQCKTVLQDRGSILGTFREPDVSIMYGPKDTETIHKENGIRFKLDPQKIMFSSGNMDERIRMGRIATHDEVIVDLFAGIGYFTLPIAVHSKPKKIYACEINKVAYDYLCQNIVLNNVTSIVEPLSGDNRKTSPKNVANRVIMGYLTDTYDFLPTAIKCLQNHTGIIHYHEVCPNELIPDRPLEKTKEIAKKHGRKIKLLKNTHVKSYAPGVSHIVLDLKVE